jgi:hypothetical protein
LDDCPICLIPDNERSPYWIDQRVCLKCGHSYHSECIHDWIKTKTASDSKVTCPMCRKELHLDDRVQVQQTLTLVNIQRNKANQERSALKHKKEWQRMELLKETRRKDKLEADALRKKQAMEHVVQLGALAESQAAAVEEQQMKEKNDAKKRMALDKERRRIQQQKKEGKKKVPTSEVRNRSKIKKQVQAQPKKKKKKEKKIARTMDDLEEDFETKRMKMLRLKQLKVKKTSWFYALSLALLLLFGLSGVLYFGGVDMDAVAQSELAFKYATGKGVKIVYTFSRSRICYCTI